MTARPGEWFFDIWQPQHIRYHGKSVAFCDVPNDVLASHPECWMLKRDSAWHGFQDLPDDYAMLDPIKVTITCPGVDAQGNPSTPGIPAPVVTKYLDTQRIIPARNGNYNILILFALGSTQGKWEALIDMLLVFKNHHDANTPLTHVLPELQKSAPVYKDMGLRDLCEAIHHASQELNIAGLSDRACAAEPEPVMTPSEAYHRLTNNDTELVDLNNLSGRILAVMVTPYPPGIPLIMPGEHITPAAQPIVDYLKALELFGRRFPGFEHELQGIETDNAGRYRVRCLKLAPSAASQLTALPATQTCARYA